MSTIIDNYTNIRTQLKFVIADRENTYKEYQSTTNAYNEARDSGKLDSELIDLNKSRIHALMAYNDSNDRMYEEINKVCANYR